MDYREIVEKCIVVGIDVCFLGVFYKLYRSQSKALKELLSAPRLDLDHDLPKKISSNGGEIPYAVVSGKAKALLTPLPSVHVPTIVGVLRRNITTEYRAAWIPFLRMWSTTDYTTKDFTEHVPFGLYGRTILSKPAHIEIMEPLVGQGMQLYKVYSDFKVPEGSLAEALLGLIFREHTVGVQEVEYMLTDNAALTVVGKLVINNDVMQIMPPDNGLTYYVSTHGYTQLVNLLKQRVSFYKSLTILMCIVSSLLFGYLFKKGYAEIKRRLGVARDLKRRQEARKALREGVAGNVPKCVVCIENPVEVIVLECGHACLCLNCSEERFAFCPVCRGTVDRLVPVYMP